MSGNFWLWAAENLHEVTDADLLIPHQIQKAQPGIVSECLEESLDIERWFSHDLYIRLDEC